MRAKLWAVAALAAGMVLGAWGESITRAGVTYARRGGLGTGDFVATNVAQTAADVGAVPNDGVWEQVKARALNTYGNVRLLPKYLHYLKLDSTYPDDAQWLYDQRGPLAFGACSARRVGGKLERTYDWLFDYSPEFVLEVGAGEGRFASVGVASGCPYLTEDFVNSGKWSRYYKCLAGATLDGINENGVVAEINVCSGTSGWHGSSLHFMGAVRWALDHGTTAQQVAEYLAANVYIPAGVDMNFHYMVADKTSTYIVENGVAHLVENSPAMFAVMTNFRLYPTDTEGEGQERAQVLANPANSITNVWWTQAYLPSTQPVRVSDIGANTQAVYAAWAEKPREEHRGETRPSGAQWWQSVHTSVYDFDALTLRLAVQETDDWYEFAVPSGGKVKSVNGRTGEVVLDAADVGALPTASFGKVIEWQGSRLWTDTTIQAYSVWADSFTAGQLYDSTTYGKSSISMDGGFGHSYTINLPMADGTIALTSDIPAPYTPDPKELCWKNNAVMTRDNTKTIGAGDIGALPNDEESLVANTNFANAVVRVSPPVELPQKWALANVTNAQGQAVGAADVHALPDTTQVPDVSTVHTGYAANADNAESAGFAENANYATSAGTAGEANTALRAGEAGRADYANEAGIANSAYTAMDTGGVQRNWNALVPLYETDPHFVAWTNSNGIAAGYQSRAYASSGTAYGRAAKAQKASSTAIGNAANANGNNATAIGVSANAVAASSMQLGIGQNETASSLQFRGTTVVDGNGQIPVASLDTPVRSIYDNNVYTQPNAELTAWNWSTSAFDGIQPRYMGDGTWQVQGLPSGWTATLPVVIDAGMDANYLPLVVKHGAEDVLVYAKRDLVTPVPSGKTWAVEDAHSLAVAFNDATGEAGGDCECIATNICRLIEPHIEAVNTVEQFWDAELEANWQMRCVSGDLKLSVSTNENMAAFIKANPVLTDEQTQKETRLHATGGELKFYTR